MAAQGTRIRSAASQAQTQNAALAAELAGCGHPWGTDLVGTLMGACYGVASGTATASFASNAAALDDHGKRVIAMAGNWQQAETSSTAAADSVRKAMG
jgi:hypothetical protein